jgi:ATP-binding cassette subfamily F protein 3
VEVAFYAQHQLESLDPGRSVLDELESVARSDDVPRLRGHLGAFLFSGDDVEKKVSVLSGGEKARLALAKMLLRPANLLVLDEPTNHLDVASCERLEQALCAYRGTLLFISHDRTLIDAVASRLVEVRAGTLTVHLGGWEDYRRRAQAAAQPGDGGGAAAPPDKQERLRARSLEREESRRQERARRRLAAVEEEIIALEGELEILGWKLGDPEVFRDGDAVRALEAERARLRDRIAERYRAWESLAEEA